MENSLNESVLRFPDVLYGALLLYIAHPCSLPSALKMSSRRCFTRGGRTVPYMCDYTVLERCARHCALSPMFTSIQCTGSFNMPGIADTLQKDCC